MLHVFLLTVSVCYVSSHTDVYVHSDILTYCYEFEIYIFTCTDIRTVLYRYSNTLQVLYVFLRITFNK